METKTGKAIYKAGKLIRITLEHADGMIVKVGIRGDFFAYPEEGIAGLEKSLEGTDLNVEAIKAKVETFLNTSQVFGFDSQQLSEAIMQAAK